jgi:hypothetical protein
MHITEQIYTIFKYLLSYRSKSWKFADYPIRVKKRDAAESINRRLKRVLWTAQIINWWQVAGYGVTREEALKRLQENFARFQKMHNSLPRPGTIVRYKLVTVGLVDKHKDLARDFLTRILDQDYDSCFISDKSSLWDFHANRGNDEYYKKIKLFYGVDVSNVEDANLGRILEQIASSRNSGHP